MIRRSAPAGVAGSNSFGGLTLRNEGRIEVPAGTIRIFNTTFDQYAGVIVLNDTTLTSDNVIFLRGGELTGSGFVTGVLRVGGGASLKPGGNPGWGYLTVTGDLQFDSGAGVTLNVTGTSFGEFDLLTVTGVATLNGTLSAPSTFVPPLGTRLRAINYGSHTETRFASVMSPFTVDYQATAADLVVTGGTPPTANNETYTTPFDTPVTVASPGVLANDTGAGPLTATIGANPTHDVVTLALSGGFTYTPAAGYSGADSFTIRALNSGGSSNLATVSLTVGAPTLVHPPTGLRVSSMTGNIVTFRWDPPTTGPTPTGFVLEAGTSPSGVLASLPLGVEPSFTVAAPAGSFFVRYTLAGAERSPASNEIELHVGVSVAPSAPTNLLATVNGDVLLMSWTNTFAGGAPTGLSMDVSGLVNGSLPLGLSDTLTLSGVPAGVYTLRLRAVNGSGTSPSSNPVTVAMPGACSGAPLPPEGFRASVTGNLLSVTWDTAASGPAPSSFVVNVTGHLVGAVPVTTRSVSAPVPAGTYNLS